MTDWISTKDRLPEDGKMVLVTVTAETIPSRIVSMNTYIGKYGKFKLEHDHPELRVAAWMYLPSVYEGE